MTQYSYAQLEGIWLNAAQGTQYATQAWAALMAAIAEAESGGNPAATNTKDNKGTQTSWGLWQISNGTHQPPDPNWNNPSVNASLAIGKLQTQGLGAWGTYTSGAYKAFQSGNTTPDTSVIAGDVSTSAAAAGASSAAADAQANCAWSVGFGPINPSSLWLNALFGGFAGTSGVSPGQICLVSNSQVRALAGIGVMLAGGLVFLLGTSVILAAAGLPVVAGAVMPGGKIMGMANRFDARQAASA